MKALLAKYSPLQLIAAAGAIISAFMVFPWSPPLNPHTVQVCAFVLFAGKVAIFKLDGKTPPSDPPLVPA